MIIYISYNKETEVVTVNSDMEDIAPIELNSNSLNNTSASLSFEIAVNTSGYEQTETYPNEVDNLEEV